MSADFLMQGGHVMAPPLFAMQSPLAVDAFRSLRDICNRLDQPFSRAIELGTAWGGLALFLRQLFEPAEVWTYDIHANPSRDRLLQNRGVVVRVADIFSEPAFSEIIQHMTGAGRTLLLCDGGDKRREFDTFAAYLKHGDMVMIHDYAISRLYFVEELQEEHWRWCEVTYPDIAQVCIRNHLVPDHPCLRPA
jgi:hypothetical protein